MQLQDLTPFEKNLSNGIYFGTGLVIDWSVNATILQLVKDEAELATLGTPGGYHEMPNMRQRWAELASFCKAEA